MKVNASNTFIKSFKKMVDTQNPLKFWYWQDKWYYLKRAVKSLKEYFWVTTKMVPWDYSSVLTMMKFQIEILANYIEKKGIEIDETRLPKIVDMRRFIELANNKSVDNYAERCGYNYCHELYFIPIEGKPNFSELASDETAEVKESNRKALMASHELEEKEWNEMFEILKNMRSWWD